MDSPVKRMGVRNGNGSAYALLIWVWYCFDETFEAIKRE